MKNNETGEFELVLGNKQLLSGFFIVVILFAVFFVMGYIVGRNSTPTTQLAASHDQTSGTSSPSNARPQPTSGTAPAPQNPPAAAAEPPKEEAAGNPPASEPEPTTKAAQPPATKTEPPTAATPAVAAPSAEPQPGDMYLQVTSVKPRDIAETVARTLKGKGLPTTLSPGPDGKTRVWVGPYTDRGKLGEAKAELERLGFGPFVVKPVK
jgi:cell division septation protein DedD